MWPCWLLVGCFLSKLKITVRINPSTILHFLFSFAIYNTHNFISISSVLILFQERSFIVLLSPEAEFLCARFGFFSFSFCVNERDMGWYNIFNGFFFFFGFLQVFSWIYCSFICCSLDGKISDSLIDLGCYHSVNSFSFSCSRFIVFGLSGLLGFICYLASLPFVLVCPSFWMGKCYLAKSSISRLLKLKICFFFFRLLLFA